MKAEQIYQKALNNGVILEATCMQIGVKKWDELMKGATRADKNKVEKIVKNHFPDDWFSFYNPYEYYKTETHIIYKHSAIEYFFKIQ